MNEADKRSSQNHCRNQMTASKVSQQHQISIIIHWLKYAFPLFWSFCSTPMRLALLEVSSNYTALYI